MHLVVLSKHEIQTRHPEYAFVCSSIVPSMKSGVYKVKLILQKQLLNEKLVEYFGQCSY